MTAYEMRISDWSSDVCSSDLDEAVGAEVAERIVAGSIRIEDSAGEEVRRPVAEQVRRKGVRREIATGTAVRADPVELVDPETGVVVELRLDQRERAIGRRDSPALFIGSRDQEGAAVVVELRTPADRKST